MSDFDTSKAVIPIMNMITEDWLKSKDIDERNTMIMWARRSRMVITVGYSAMGICYFLIVILPAFGTSITYVSNDTETGKLMPMHVYHQYDITHKQYELMYITNAVVMLLSIVAYTGIDSFLGLLVFHICGQLDILRTRISYLDKLIKFQDGLKICVIRHIRLLRCGTHILSVYFMPLFSFSLLEIDYYLKNISAFSA